MTNVENGISLLDFSFLFNLYCFSDFHVLHLWFVFLFPVTEVHGRTFGVWTLLTCTLCYLCAFNLENKPLYLATFLSFVYALSHFLTEYLIYHTMAIANLSTVGFIAGIKSIHLASFWINRCIHLSFLYATCFKALECGCWLLSTMVQE